MRKLHLAISNPLYSLRRILPFTRAVR